MSQEPGATERSGGRRGFSALHKKPDIKHADNSDRHADLTGARTVHGLHALQD